MTPTIGQPEHVSWFVEWLREHPAIGGVVMLLLAGIMVRMWWASHVVARSRIEDMEEK